MNPFRAGIAAGLLATLAAAPALPQKKGRKTFSETTSVVVVEVPVTVVRDGEPVTGLTAENFEITDEKKKRTITGFEVVDLKRIGAPAALEQPLPIAARRHFLMFFDLAWSQPESVVKAREAAMDLVAGLHPTDLAGVAVYTSTQGANLLLNFTSDRRQLELAIQTLGVPQLVQRASDPLGLVFGSLRDIVSSEVVGGAETEGASGAGGEFEQIANEQILDMANRVAAAERANDVNKVSAFTGNLEALADLLAAIDGRKNLVYFSEGIPSDILVGQEQTVEQQQGRAGTDIWNLKGDETFGSTRSQNMLEDMIEKFRRAGCAIQSVDIGGARALHEIGGRKSGEESLVSMATDTGGEFFRNFNDLGAAMEKMLERTSVTYLLAFQPEDLRLDGAYHRLKVKLKDAPRGVRLSHRSGYYAPLPYSETNPVRRRLENAEIIMGGEEGGPLEVDVLAASFPVEGENAYVPLLVEIGGESLLAGRPEALELEVYAYATDTETGRVYDFFAHPLALDLSQGQVRSGLEATGLKYWGHFDLPPGSYTARVMVRDRQDGRYSLKRQALTVPGAGGFEAQLLPPMFPEAPGKWILAREGEDRRRDVPYPFMAGAEAYIPSVKPVVPARGSTPFYLQGVNLSGEAAFEAEVVTSEGAPVRAAALKLAPAVASNGSRSVAAELETRGLDPGEYTLVARVRDASGGTRSSSIRFVVR